MFALSLGISHISEVLPEIVYAMLSGLNAATVGMVALGAVRLSGKAVTDKVSRMLVFLGATAGMLYNALWYFPVIITLAGCVTLVWDSGVLGRAARCLLSMVRRGRPGHVEPDAEFTCRPLREEGGKAQPTSGGKGSEQKEDTDAKAAPVRREPTVSWQLGTLIIAAFFIIFIAVMVTRAVVHSRPLLFRLFSNMYLAGTIIFGGGPVVVPLLRE